jgi:hypothetical protein
MVLPKPSTSLTPSPSRTEEQDERTRRTREEEEQPETEEVEEKPRRAAEDDDEVVVSVDGQEHRIAVKDLKRLFGQEASLTQKSQQVPLHTARQPHRPSAIWPLCNR